ncbi:hypothetical protein L226DRAFT_156738 [Lentinus tigrinus ALCF2SS1-7]|uniref:Uncharacterized protein n=1 Tax=Lentinus tigrinus ALCF2SS1-6 TaxID=1328759 RepID=A0A5C2S3D4_9APHY|nr:hypothetical protein L227DRAFT_196855 [Lentinus tigrinus ALCF2SS1-6]RPD72201.1 hypothetical protein L226DRAFT_156738 [Lentinus tigrinus ALCF2SS1-7]
MSVPALFRIWPSGCRHAHQRNRSIRYLRYSRYALKLPELPISRYPCMISRRLRLTRSGVDRTRIDKKAVTPPNGITQLYHRYLSDLNLTIYGEVCLEIPSATLDNINAGTQMRRSSRSLPRVRTSLSSRKRPNARRLVAAQQVDIRSASGKPPGHLRHGREVLRTDLEPLRVCGNSFLHMAYDSHAAGFTIRAVRANCAYSDNQERVSRQSHVTYTLKLIRHRAPVGTFCPPRRLRSSMSTHKCISHYRRFQRQRRACTPRTYSDLQPPTLGIQRDTCICGTSWGPYMASSGCERDPG